MKKFTDRIRNINYKYFFSELFIVVVGILIALSLNSWREYNANKSREQFYLKSLKTDFEQSLASLNEIYYQNQNSYSAVKNVLEVIGEGDFNLTSDSSKSLLSNNLFGFNRFVPASGTYKEIISTGSLQILNDDQLRIALSSWDDMILRNRQLEDVMFWQYHIINIPYLNKHIARADFAGRYNLSTPGKKDKTNYKALFEDVEFENILINRAGALMEANGYIQQMTEQVKHIIGLINKDLNGGL